MHALLIGSLLAAPTPTVLPSDFTLTPREERLIDPIVVTGRALHENYRLEPLPDLPPSRGGEVVIDDYLSFRLRLSNPQRNRMTRFRMPRMHGAGMHGPHSFRGWPYVGLRVTVRNITILPF